MAKRSGMGCGTVLALLIIGFLLWLLSPRSNREIAAHSQSDAPFAATPSASKPVWSPTTQAVADRVEMIKRLQGQGIFGDVTRRGNTGHLIVKPGFYALDFKEKQTFASVAFAWCKDQTPTADTLLLLDSKSNKQVGHLFESEGTLVME
jgi:hypothetical protein